MQHAWWQLSQAVRPSITHLRTVNAYVVSSINAAAMPARLPRQTAPAPPDGQDGSGGLVAVSSFAFQASFLVISCGTDKTMDTVAWLVQAQ